MDYLDKTFIYFYYTIFYNEILFKNPIQKMLI